MLLSSLTTVCCHVEPVLLPRDAMHKCVLCCHAVCCVHLSVTFVCQNEWSYLRNLFTVVWPSHSSFSSPNVMAVFRLGPPNGGVQCSWGRHKSQFCMNSRLSIDDCCSVQSTIDGLTCSSVSQLWCMSVYNTDHHVSVYALKRREENRIYLYAAVSLKRK